MELNRPIPEPWRSFLTEIDGSLSKGVSFHCFGGFAIDHLFGLPRTTSDVDVMSGVVGSHHKMLLAIAGKNSQLHKSTGYILISSELSP